MLLLTIFASLRSELGIGNDWELVIGHWSLVINKMTKVNSQQSAVNSQQANSPKNSLWCVN
ncbi:hypothetical protein Osc7112_2970 [Oscillatoria nigro-viridis PCC 7112]|uniref:Uncharacterized protein n=1 Tax=Phormidium nigroviride PCC 7112 TaxID=179408 RepID=K9VGZ7_9CYAN|nr:hypothetical protein Osc7112_2970 [Oscillatoria nigro-viridis PCC 7112]